MSIGLIFVELDFQEELKYDTFVVDKPISLVKLAELLNVEYEELKRLNPGYKSDFVPIYQEEQMPFAYLAV